MAGESKCIILFLIRAREREALAREGPKFPAMELSPCHATGYACYKVADRVKSKEPEEDLALRDNRYQSGYC